MSKYASFKFFFFNFLDTGIIFLLFWGPKKKGSSESSNPVLVTTIGGCSLGKNTQSHTIR